MKLHDLTGMQFHYLTVVKASHSKRGDMYWNCICKCGKETVTKGTHLKSGNTKSCGCYRDELYKINAAGSRRKNKLYRVWQQIRYRCYNPKVAPYKNYGGRGIRVSEEWRNNFDEFYEWAMRNGYKDGLEVDRIDNNGDYGPNNCRLADRKTQLNNTRRNVFIEFDGKKLTIAQWSQITGINRTTLSYRLRKGWDTKRMFGG